MATRRLRPEDWAPVPQTRIHTRRAGEPRDERVRIPKSKQRVRPTPINISPGKPSPIPNAPPTSPRDSGDGFESPREPEIVDLAAPNTWPRRGPLAQRPFSRRMASPSTASQYSARQSEISFGILDYYTRDPSPLNSPKLLPPTPKLDLLPQIETRVVDPAIEKFDFGLPPPSPSPQPQPQPCNHDGFQQILPDTTAGAESNCDDPLPPNTAPTQPRPERKAIYTLFPTVKDTTPPSKPPARPDPQTPQHSTPRSNITSIPSHQQPDPSYRPRKESLSSSVRSRKDSFTSFCATRRIPMRILSSSSPTARSRWSDDTIASPTAATTPGPRTSFGSLLERDSAQYPACFFEDDDDDDEGVPLRKKFAWTRSVSLTQERQGRKARRFDERGGFGRRVVGVLLCGGCCG